MYPVNHHENYKRFFCPFWYQNFLKFINTICYKFFAFQFKSIENAHDDDDDDEYQEILSSDSSVFCSSLFFDCNDSRQTTGSEQNLNNPEDRRRIEHNYYQTHAAHNTMYDDMDELDEVTSDHAVLIQKPKNYGTLSSQIISNERLDYMWKNIDVFGEATPTDVPLRRKFWDRVKSCCSRSKKHVVPRKHLLKNGESGQLLV